VLKSSLHKFIKVKFRGGSVLLFVEVAEKAEKASAKVTGHEMSDKRGKAQQRAFGCLVTQFEGLVLDWIGLAWVGFGLLLPSRWGKQHRHLGVN